MTTLVFLLLAFGFAHLIPAFPGVKQALVARLGKAYGPLYGIATLVLLVATLWAFRQAPAIAVYTPPDWGYYANFALSLVGFIFIGIYLFRGSWRNSIKYAMAYGLGFWALGHLFANGDARTLMFFIGLAAFGFLHVWLKARQGAYVPSEERQGHNMLSVMAGVVLYGIAAQLHYVIAGVHVVALK
jgi:uncharacterized membrane protein